ncbi:uncharacterized protein LOC114294912 [Camellia sinensis]|uniref:uncharacterized protein LOC114294912 n=1 Tax=Camellia sinensis TaxID=4442 RepID=UPI001035803C|nr:uncharacterized protein LOC114294912 [Camellia sinensis]
MALESTTAYNLGINQEGLSNHTTPMTLKSTQAYNLAIHKEANTSGQFSVNSVWQWWLAANGPGVNIPVGLWVKSALPKMQFFCWLAWRERVKTSSFLKRIGVLAATVSSYRVFSNVVEETLDHVLLFCPLTWECWSLMVRWWDLVWDILGSVRGLLHWWSGGKFKPKESRIWQVIPSVVFWYVWKLRNDCKFKGALPAIEDLTERIKLHIALWAKWLLKVDYSVYDFVSNLHQVRLSVRGA